MQQIRHRWDWYQVGWDHPSFERGFPGSNGPRCQTTTDLCCDAETSVKVLLKVTIWSYVEDLILCENVLPYDPENPSSSWVANQSKFQVSDEIALHLRNLSNSCFCCPHSKQHDAESRNIWSVSDWWYTRHRKNTAKVACAFAPQRLLSNKTPCLLSTVKAKLHVIFYSSGLFLDCVHVLEGPSQSFDACVLWSSSGTSIGSLGAGPADPEDLPHRFTGSHGSERREQTSGLFFLRWANSQTSPRIPQEASQQKYIMPEINMNADCRQPWPWGKPCAPVMIGTEDEHPLP